MEYAEFSQQYIRDLKKELGLFGVLFCIKEYVCVCACVCVCVCACVCVWPIIEDIAGDLH